MQNERPKKNKLIRTLIYLSILFVSTFVGTVAGYFYNANSEPVYQSHARIHIETKELREKVDGLDFSSVSEARHDQLFPQADLVAEAFEKHNLSDLKCFRDLPPDRVIPSVVENLEVSQNKAEVDASLFRLTFRCSQPRESQTILTSLVSTYRSRLDKQQETILREYESGLAAAEKDMEQRIKNRETVREQELETRVEIETKRLALSLAGLTGNRRSGVVRLTVLESATHGEAIWPVLLTILLVGAAIGFAAGMVLILFSLLLEKLAG